MTRAILAVLLFASLAYAALEDRPCVTDSECFVQCERDLGRPCTDADVFGEPYTVGDECPPNDCNEGEKS